MQYLLMICGDETAEEHRNDGCGGWSEDLARRGKIRGGGGLRPPSEATTIRVRDGEVLLTDGPFTEAKEQIGGYVVLECDDLDEALEIAAKHPAATYGSIEVRPILTFEEPA